MGGVDLLQSIMFKMRKYGGSCILCGRNTRSFAVFYAPEECTINELKSTYFNEYGERFTRYIPYFICNKCGPKDKSDTKNLEKVEEILIRRIKNATN